MSTAQFIHNNTWTTDDERFIFSFKLETDNASGEKKVLICLRYITLTNNQKPLWEDKELMVDGKAFEFLENYLDGLLIKGTIKAFTQESATSRNLIVWGDIRHGAMGQLNRFTGPMALERVAMSTPSLPSPPPLPPPPAKPSGQIAAEDKAPMLPGIAHNDTYHDLFPFIYLSHWPDINEHKKKLGFIKYEPVITSPPINSFYYTLESLNKKGDREGMEGEAAQFIEGKGTYKDLFLSEEKELSGKTAQFHQVLEEIHYADNNNTLLVTIFRVLDASSDEVLVYLKSPEYIYQKEWIWQSYFALIIKLGFSSQWLDHITKLLVACHVLEQIFFSLIEDNNTVSLSINEIRELCRATIILPESIFPLPTHLGVSVKQSACSDVKLYAIGNLQMVKQKLLRYEIGEIANIVSVMPGEKKESTHRKLHQESDKTSYTELSQSTDFQDNQEVNTDLANEVLKTLAHSKESFAYNDYSTNYGAPTSLTLNGGLDKEKVGIKPKQVKASSFAKKIISETSATISKQIGNQRVRLVNHEQEETAVSILDNTGNNNAVYGTYYWLNKVYEARMVKYGTRLMLSFLIPNPSEQYIKAEFNFKNERLTEPKSPEELFQIGSFNHIKRDNYIQVCEYYGLNEYELPPEQVKIVSGILEGNESKFIEIPKGYQADIAYVTYISDKANSKWKVNGFVGRQAFNFVGATGAFNPLKLSKEDNSIPISATCDQPLLSPPLTIQAFRINIEVDCTCSDKALNEWKKKLYRQIIQAYNEQRKAYFNKLNSNTYMNKNSNPLYKKKTIKKEFRKACIKQLVSNMHRLKGFAVAQGQGAAAEFEEHNPYFQNYINHAIEWNEMTYYLLEDFGSELEYSGMEVISSGNESFFNAFLQAEAARVMVPVRPELNQSIIFFLSTGLLWRGQDKLAPAITRQAALVYEIKQLEDFREEQHEASENWEFKIPTSLQILSNKLDLNKQAAL